MLNLLVALAGTAAADAADFVCDGLNDDVEINAAIAAVADAGGGVVSIAAGSYSTSLPIVCFGDGVAIEGDAAGGTIIRPASDWASFASPDGAGVTGIVSFVGADGFAARNLTVESDLADSPNGIIAIPTGVNGAGEFSTNGVIENNIVRMPQGHNYSIWSVRSEDISITGNLVEGGASVENVSTAQEGIEIYGGRHVLIEGNTISGIGNSAINLGGLANLTPDSSIEDISILGNTVINSRVGIAVGTTWDAVNGAADAKNILIENNQFEDIFEIGFQIRNWTGNAGNPPVAEDIVFRGNDVGMVYSQTSGYSPSGVTFFNATAAGETLQGNILVENNSFTTAEVEAVPPGLPFSTPGVPFVWLQDFGGTTLKDNSFDLFATSEVAPGISVRHGDNVTLEGNAIKGAGLMAIELVNSSHFGLYDNVVEHWGRGAATAAISVDTGQAYEVLRNQIYWAGEVAPQGTIILHESDPPTAMDDNLLVSQMDVSLAGSLINDLTLLGDASIGTGNNLDNFIVGNDVDNVLDGAGGADTLIGAMGNDVYYVDSAGDVVVELAGGGDDEIRTSVSYTLAPTAAIEQLTARDAFSLDPINLFGNRQDQVIRGNDGNNILHGGGGVDTLIGGGGNDTYYTDVAATQVVEAPGGGVDAVYSSVSYVLAGNAEVEYLLTSSDAGTAPINLTGNGFSQTIFGNAGANVLHGGGGVDTLVGRGGNDTYYTDVAATQIVEAAGGGIDVVYSSVSYVLGGNAEVEYLLTNNDAGTSPINLTGNSFSQTIFGNAGANVLRGGGGVDTLVGRAGNDTYYTDVAATQIVEAAGEGTDAVYSSVSYVLGSGAEVEYLLTNSDAGTASINLTGNAFSQTIFGNAGANILDGKGGTDLLVGRGGADTFAFTTALGAEGLTSIADFAVGVDKIGLDQAVFAIAPGSLSPDMFAIGASAQDSSDRIIYNAQSGWLYFDPDGAGGADAIHFANLQAQLNLSANDFFGM